MSEEEAEAWGVAGTMPHARGVLEAPSQVPTWAWVSWSSRGIGSVWLHLDPGGQGCSLFTL